MNRELTESKKEGIKMTPLLEISNLSIGFIQYYENTKQRIIHPVLNLNLDIYPAEIVAIVGASGSGKSLLAHAVLDVLPVNSIVNYKMKYKGEKIESKDLRKLRGKQFRFIPQSVQFLDPTRTVGRQIQICKEDMTREEAECCLELFSLDKSVYDDYPHELSGGMLRRVLFATCYGKDTELIIADEPTPGIHPEALEEILNQLRVFKNQGISVIFITHDMESALEVADRVAVFKDGKVVSVHTPAEILENKNLDEYTKRLWDAQPVNEFMEAIK